MNATDARIWWHPPSGLAPSERYGLSTAQIARMSDAAYDAYVTRAYNEGRSLPRDGGNDARGYAYRVQSRRAAKKLSPDRRKLLEQARRASFRFGMGCIAVEDLLAGGGTYSIHAPHWLFEGAEAMIWSLQHHWPRRKVPADRLDAVGAILRRCRDLQQSPARYGGRVDVASLHRYAKLALDSERELIHLAARFDDRGRANIYRFIVEWGKNYVAIREADKVIAPVKPS